MGHAPGGIPQLVEAAGSVIKMAKEKGIKLYTPVDAVIAREIDAKAPTMIAPVQEIPAEWMALDIGPGVIRKFEQVISDSKSILWNGPLGVFEMPNYAEGTFSIARAVGWVAKWM